MSRWFPRLLVLTVLAQTAIYAARPMVSYRALALGAEPAELGLIVGSFAALPLLIVVPVGRWADQWGERWVLLAGSLVVTLSSVALLWAGTLGWLLVCNAALGAGHVMSVVGIQTLIARGSQPERRDRRFAFFTVFNSLSLLLGPAAAGLLVGDVSAVHQEPAAGAVADGATAGGATAGGVAASDAAAGIGQVFGLAAGLAAGAALLAVSLLLLPGQLALRPPAGSVETPRNSRQAVAEVLRLPSMARAMFASLTVLSAVDILVAYLPAYAEANGISVRMVGFLLATQGFAALVSRIFMLTLIRLITRRWVLVSSMGAAAATLVVLPFTTWPPLLYGLMVVAGFGLGLGQPVTLAWVASQAPRDIRGTAMGIRLSGNRLGQTVIPAAVGGLGSALGLAALFLSPAVLLALGSALVVRARFD